MTPYRTAAVVAIAVLLGVSCGEDFQPPALPTTGELSPVGQVIDVEAGFPHLVLPGRVAGGLEMEIRFEMEETGEGHLPARVFFGPARYEGTTDVVVEDEGDGRATVFVTEQRWSTGVLGPLRIDDTVFEITLDGVPERGGRYVIGSTWESHTGLQGGFEGWRRHRFLVAGTDFFSGVGRVSEVALLKGDRIVVRPGLELVSSDPVLRVSGGAVFAINRFTHDNIQRLDPQSLFATSWQSTVGAGANPHDVAVLSETKAFVTRYEPPFDDVAVFDPRSGSIETSIPLEGLAENPDATPRADRMKIADGVLFVALQDIDRTFTQFAEGKLAVIDPALEEIVGTIPLGGKNPGAIELLRGADDRLRLYVALSGIFPGLQTQELSGGVAVVDVTQRAVERYALDDDDAGGNIGGLAMASERLGYAVVSDDRFVNRVVAFDPESATLRRTLWESSDLISEIEIDGDGILAIPDRSFFQPRLCLYRAPSDPSDDETLIGCGDLDAPPFTLEALD
jgi:hypothetical protein